MTTIAERLAALEARHEARSTLDESPVARLRSKNQRLRHAVSEAHFTLGVLSVFAEQGRAMSADDVAEAHRRLANALRGVS